ncbi:MAG TPA: tetratricopeptide repeat protein [Myxococcaceae bacterium]|nr:tetratricopeptide repeat protein [Myxococcaceae bacterium]
MTGRAPCWVALLPGLLAGVAAGQGRSIAQISAQVEQVHAQAKNAEDNLQVVETHYVGQSEPTGEEALLRRFSDGEIQYLLGDYTTASVLFYDLVGDRTFQKNSRYPDALFYLGDALYRQGNWGSARVYLRELLTLDSPRFREALAEYLEATSRLNDFSNIETYIQRARGPNGELPPELAYVYGKWLFKRTDVPREERLAQSAAVFEKLAADPAGRYRLAALYFLGVIEVERGNYDAALARFTEVAKAQARDTREQKIVELANLSQGRVLVEQGKFTEAVDRYQEVPRESDAFPESIYETAWAKVRAGDFEGAKNATDILLLVSPDSTLAPDAQILQGHLLLKLKRYREATDTYNGVINTYAPVRDELDALLNVNKDPVAYFDNLLLRNERNLDVNALLPPVALKWATTQAEVNDALTVVKAMDDGRKGVGDGEQLADRILKALGERGMEAFPALQEGYTRADAVSTALVSAEQSLTQAEAELVAPVLTADERAQLQRLLTDESGARARLATLPTTSVAVADRRRAMQDRIDALDREAFRVGYELQSMNAVLAAVQKWVADTRAQRKGSAADEKAFQERVRAEQQAAAALEREVDALRAELRDARAKADTSLSGEEALRAEVISVESQAHQVIAQAESRLTDPAAKAVIARAHAARDRLDALAKRTEAAKAALQARVRKKGDEIRDKVLAEQMLLQQYTTDVTRASGEARQLVGRIAFDSFRRVRGQFYDLVLKADVGVVDVAFTRKQDKTSDIQKTASQKDRELKALDDEFKEVLRDVD